jgi:hypothetical protein
VHVQIVTFSLEDINEDDYRNQAEPIAPAFAGLPGLISSY